MKHSQAVKRRSKSTVGTYVMCVKVVRLKRIVYLLYVNKCSGTGMLSININDAIFEFDCDACEGNGAVIKKQDQ